MEKKEKVAEFDKYKSLEKTLKTNKPGYQDYIKRTNAFFPWFPKNKY